MHKGFTKNICVLRRVPHYEGLEVMLCLSETCKGFVGLLKCVCFHKMCVLTRLQQGHASTRRLDVQQLDPLSQRSISLQDTSLGRSNTMSWTQVAPVVGVRNPGKYLPSKERNLIDDISMILCNVIHTCLNIKMVRSTCYTLFLIWTWLIAQCPCSALCLLHSCIFQTQCGGSLMLNSKKNNQRCSVLVPSWATRTTRGRARTPAFCRAPPAFGWVTVCEPFDCCTWYYSKSPIYWPGLFHNNAVMLTVTMWDVL